MSKALKWSILALVLVVLAAILSHGVVLPRFVWQPQLQRLAQTYPGVEMDAQRVVVALSHKPALLVSGLAIRHHPRQEQLQIGLLRLRFNAVKSLTTGRLQLEQVGVKSLYSQANTQSDCLETPLACMPRLPLALLGPIAFGDLHQQASFWSPQWAVKRLNIEQAEFEINNPDLQQNLLGKIDQAAYTLGATAHTNNLNVGWRLDVKAPGLHNAITVAFKATPVAPLHFENLQLDLDGTWATYPWTASAAQDHLHLKFEQANGGTGAPLVQVAGGNLRTYIRRNDAPETHQAAFSAQTLRGGLPAQPWAFEQAEWTYTHEDAQAWTFNLNYQPELGRIAISPTTIEGSEGLPAEAQVRELNCGPQANIRPDKPHWAWHDGWFRLGTEAMGSEGAWVLCPLQSGAEPA